MKLAPITLFCYNRLNHLRQTIECLAANSLAVESDLIVFSDAAKNEAEDIEKVKNVRVFLREIKGFKSVTVYESAANNGLAQSVISGVTAVFKTHESTIVMEDDLECTSDFLAFMNDALQAYQNNPLICSVTGFTYPFKIPQNYNEDVFLVPRGSSWGWGTWKNRWNTVDWQVSDYQNFIYSKTQKQAFTKAGADLLPMLIKQQKRLISSWAVRWSYHHYKTQTYCLHPITSKINHIGHDGTGTNEHSLKGTKIENKPIHLPEIIAINDLIISNLYQSFKPSPTRRLLNWWRYGIGLFELV
jgi:hypothetical protein